MKFSLPRIAGILILLMWAASLALPTISACRAGYDHAPGVFLLAIGWMGLLMLQPAWIANILILVIAGMLLVRQRAPIWLGVLTVVIAGCGWFFTALYDDTGPVPICHYHAGYWLWFATAAVALLATFLLRAPAKA